mmetsp:Transcript_23481/g.51709  ORF Transcript_23481/g.51709 Transcript_23481/m.51709 type:complete len:295 (-) Transcript_23481:886-1770(-)
MVVRPDRRYVRMMPSGSGNQVQMNRQLVHVVRHFFCDVRDVLNTITKIPQVLSSCPIYVHDHNQRDPFQHIQMVMQPIPKSNSWHTIQPEDRPRAHRKSTRSRGEQPRQRWIDHLAQRRLLATRTSTKTQWDHVWEPIELKIDLHKLLFDHARRYLARESREWQLTLHSEDRGPRRYPLPEMTPHFEPKLSTGERLGQDEFAKRHGSLDSDWGTTLTDVLSHAAQQGAPTGETEIEHLTNMTKIDDKTVQIFEPEHRRQHPGAGICFHDNFLVDIGSQNDTSNVGHFTTKIPTL